MPHPPTLAALSALVPLGSLPRTGWVIAGVPAPESIAAHSHGVCLLVLALAPRVSPPIDVDRAVALAAIHDAPEALLSDLPRSASALFPEGAKRHAELAAADQLLPPLSPIALERFEEYVSAETREARFSGLCDRLHMGVMLVAYLRAGIRGLSDFADSIAALDCSEFPPCGELQTEILDACREQRP